MKVVPFLAETPAAALAQIHEQLGPDAIVLSMRPLPPQGLARLWQKSRGVEVLACVAEPDGRTNSVFQDQQSSIATAVSALSNRVAPALHDGTGRPHVFIGPPGTGKTTLLCKWMTRSVLSENRTARVWRLDGAGANTAEFLNIYSEMLGVPVERLWNPPPGDLALDRSVESESRHLARPKADLLLIDLPGIQPGDADAVRTLKKQLAALPAPRVHLVLNAAYESAILSEQFRAFACFQPEDLSFSHLDEEKSQAKLLDFILGTNCCLRFLSTGQKIPGDLVLAGHSSPASPALAA